MSTGREVYPLLIKEAESTRGCAIYWIPLNSSKLGFWCSYKIFYSILADIKKGGSVCSPSWRITKQRVTVNTEGLGRFPFGMIYLIFLFPRPRNKTRRGFEFHHSICNVDLPSGNRVHDHGSHLQPDTVPLRLYGFKIQIVEDNAKLFNTSLY